jgi:HSP20 family molecular chaperone IbpA
LEYNFDKFFNEFFKGSRLLDSIKSTSGYPKMDIYVDGDEWVIQMAIPGVSPNEIKVEISKDNVLTISGEVSEEYQSSKDAVHYFSELKKSSFMRQLKLPKWVDGDPKAKTKDGMLTLRWKLPKEEEKSSRVIDIEVD